METLRHLLHYYKGNSNSRFLYVTNSESLYDITTGRLCWFVQQRSFADSMVNCTGFLLRFFVLHIFIQEFMKMIIFSSSFQRRLRKKEIVFEEAPAQEVHFLSLSDLSNLLYKIFDNWNDQGGSTSGPEGVSFLLSSSLDRS